MDLVKIGKFLQELRKEKGLTQEQLAELLLKSGYNVTQATISRDIRELKLSKVSTENGKQKYVEVAKNGVDDSFLDKYVRILQNGFVSMDRAMNIIVIKTVPGMAMAVAAAIDTMHFDGVAGCIAGDDTIMCAVKTVEDTEHVIARLRKIISDNRK